MIVITMENMGGELDRREVKTEDDAKAAMIEMIEAVSFLQDGDRFFVREKEG
jgi:hypothetical protein